MTREPIIIYVPGMKPKPPVAMHRAMLWKCLVEGVRRADQSAAESLEAHADQFRLAAWAPLFYSMEKDIAEDLPGIDRLFELTGPEENDLYEAAHWHKRLGRLIYLLSDAFPSLIDYVANEAMKATLQETQRYFDNLDGVATQIRELVVGEITSAWETSSRVLLVAHSLGSVIAYDVLWELSRRLRSAVRIDMFMTLGSPLGLNFVRHRLLSAHQNGERRFPDNIRRWCNLSAIGEMTALDRRFADDFRPMTEMGLIESISDDTGLRTYFRGPHGLNVHKCYGYMINERVGAMIGRWWLGKPETRS